MLNSAPKGSIAAYGETEAQTVTVLKSIEANLKSLNLTMSDGVKMQAFLVGDPGFLVEIEVTAVRPE